MASTDGPAVVVRAGGPPVRVGPGGRCVIGRSSGADVRVDDRKVSREHAEISIADGRIWLTDLGSKRGTYLDGTRVSETTELARPASIHLAGPDGPAVVVEDAPAGTVADGQPGPPSTYEALIVTLKGRPLLAGAVALFALIVGIAGVRTVFSGSGPSARGQLVGATIDPATAPSQSGTAVIVDGELGLVAVPRVAEPGSAVSYTVQVPMADRRIFDVAATRVASVDDVELIQLVGASSNPELMDRLGDFGTIDIGQIGDSPDEVWVYGPGEDGQPGAIATPVSGSRSGTLTLEAQAIVAFAPVIDGERLAGFGRDACTTAEGATVLEPVDAHPLGDVEPDAEGHTNAVGPAPILASGLPTFTPEPCE